MDETNPDTATSTGIPPVAVSDDGIEQPPPTKQDNSNPPATAAASSPTPASNSPLLQALTDRALDFLSHASNETLGACLVGLGASTYFVLGRVGLVIIGVASGVVLHATWADVRGDQRDLATRQAEEERKRETGLDIARRLMEWRSDARLDSPPAEDAKVYATQDLEYAAAFGPEAVTALNTFTDAVIKDYVHYWYDPTVPGEMSFPVSCRRTFMAFVLSLSGHLQHQRPADAFMTFMTNASSMIIVFLHELSLALNASPNSSPEEAISAYLQMKPDSSLAYMLDEKAQKLKLADTAETILQDYLDPKSYNCPPVHSFLKQILAQLVLGYTVELCSRPEWINDWIVYGLEESETTKEVMDIVDAGVEGRSTATISKVADRPSEPEHSPVQSNKEGTADITSKPAVTHRRQVSLAEEAMDEAMQEAKRLTEMMIEEDRRKAHEDAKRRSTPTLGEDSSDGATQGAQTPSSSQSGRDKQDEDSTTTFESPMPTEDKPTSPGPQFTSFDQLVPNAQPTALTDGPSKAPPRPQSVTLTLYNASMSIFDDSNPNERSSMKAKPTTDYNIMIEPASKGFGGWMVTRKYADFETLHEVLRRISVITGARFNETHAELPKWKVQTKSSLRTELERYLCDAVRYQSLAESEGMKRFLERDQGLSKSPSSGKGFGWPTPDAFGKLGGDMMTVLTKAPKQVAGGVAGGGKAVFGGVAGLVGGVGVKRINTPQPNLTRSVTNVSIDGAASPVSASRESMSDGQSLTADPMTGSYVGSVTSGRDSMDSTREPPQSLVERSTVSTMSQEAQAKSSAPSTRPTSLMSGSEYASNAESSLDSFTAQPSSKGVPLEQTMNLPPPPSEMPADYNSAASTSRINAETRSSTITNEHIPQSASGLNDLPPKMPPRPEQAAKIQAKPREPISERETSIAVELMFAVITELYTLSGAWQIRKTLLNAAKTFLLRPGNPQIISIQSLLQTSLLDSNFDDAGLAHHIYKLRENTLPTEEEMEIWRRDYPEKTDEQKEELRSKARKLLVTKGMPQALTSVMGAAASGEALGKVFDCLQMPRISRGLIFGLMLQALRIVMQ